MRIGITGMLGVIGTHLTDRLNKEHIDYVGLDNKTVLHESYGDINNVEDTRKLASGCDGIVHLAGVSNSLGKELDLNLAHKVNVLGTLNVIDAITITRQPKWLLFVSCYNVYGNQVKLPVSEWVKCQPNNVLGMSKLLAEDLIHSKCSKLNIPYIILRLSNVYGSNHVSASTTLPNLLIQEAIRGDSLTCFGEKATSDFIHIDDVVDALMKTIELIKSQHRPLPPRVNICSGVETSMFELAERVRRLIQTSSTINIGPMYTGQIERFVGSIEKAKKLLKWSPSIQLDDGLKRLHASLIKFRKK